MHYHFKIHKESDGYWGECCELDGCMSQGGTRAELMRNLREALNLYLDEPKDSQVLFKLPRKRVQGRNIVTVAVDSKIALAVMVRHERLKKKWTQKTTAEKLGIPLYSYQKLESSRTANPQWKTLVKLRRLFPSLDLNLAS